MFAEIGNNECTEMQLKGQDSQNHTVSINTPTAGRIGFNLSAANHTVVNWKFWVWNVQCLIFAPDVSLGQNQFPQVRLQNTGPAGNTHSGCDHHQRSGELQVAGINLLMSHPKSVCW